MFQIQVETGAKIPGSNPCSGLRYRSSKIWSNFTLILYSQKPTQQNPTKHSLTQRQKVKWLRLQASHSSKAVSLVSKQPSKEFKAEETCKKVKMITKKSVISLVFIFLNIFCLLFFATCLKTEIREAWWHIGMQYASGSGDMSLNPGKEKNIFSK